ncbi:UvrD-helicase domain-containing protein [Aquisalibacillus elongatus]|uniref:DNA 3'-5' helicase n=1 Tax=Aquisalibacillus elongatus TaxID=485577 RepID=A0A3N5BCU5_9BACI|nr:UvrD-helicase domain-containing protein [Aquisalibacillus elongatus]RPF55257.1 DNA helicase-4 [Aquisalibacillus elongatus]
MVEIIILIILASLIFLFYRSFTKRKLMKSDFYTMVQDKSEQFLIDFGELKTKYIASSDTEELKERYSKIYKRFLKNKTLFRNMTKEMKSFYETYRNLSKLVREWNMAYVEYEIKETEELLNNVDDKSLDDQQREAIVTDEDNNLVIAGAGSGKTLTVAGKVKYLVQRKKIDPDNILLITFTKKATEEMRERIVEDLGIGVKTTTFHRLGLDIISYQRGYRPEVTENLNQILTDFFVSKVKQNPKLVEDVIYYFGFYQSVPSSYDEIENLDELYKSYKHMNLETLKSTIDRKIEETKELKKTLQRETVKSFEEVLIANFLYLNGIKYEYERIYPYDVNDRYRKKYRPDFYLPEYDLYIEHFGINKDFRTPWLNEIEEEKYLEGIHWKRSVHKEKGTNLLETYSYYNQDNQLLSKIEEKLTKAGVEFHKPDLKEVYTNIFLSEREENYFKETKKLMATFINLYKSQGFDLDEFNRLEEELKQIENPFLQRRSLLFLSMTKNAYSYYQTRLNDNNEIDFNDMINHATVFVEDSHSLDEDSFLNFDYIIIDEFQDISVSRFNLVNAIKEQSNSKVLSVGDDWQSIYRFAGSDLDLFSNYNQYTEEATEQLKIEKTYRNSQDLIDIAGQFIMKNPSQITKNLVSNKSNDHPVYIYGYNQDYYKAFSKAIESIVEDKGEETDIFVLGRNNFDKDRIIQLSDGELRLYRDRDRNDMLEHKKFPNLRIQYLTVHRSKGLQASNVIIINLRNDKLGFPNKISDDPILSFVLSNKEDFEFGEERRLFYVALTRTLNDVYLITPEKDMSIFVNELIKSHGLVFNLVTGETYNGSNPKCPRCKGTLILRENSFNRNQFLGCSNYPYCDYSFKDPNLLHNEIKCPSCKGYMIKRKGRYGEFYGCENYPFCENKIKI